MTILSLLVKPQLLLKDNRKKIEILKILKIHIYNKKQFNSNNIKDLN
jgi:hypothetical protein